MNLSIQHKVVLFFNNSSPKNKITKDMYAPKFMWSCLHNEKFYDSRLWWLLCPHHLHQCSIMSCHYKQNVRAPTIFAFFPLLFLADENCRGRDNPKQLQNIWVRQRSEACTCFIFDRWPVSCTSYLHRRGGSYPSSWQQLANHRKWKSSKEKQQKQRHVLWQ